MARPQMLPRAARSAIICLVVAWSPEHLGVSGVPNPQGHEELLLNVSYSQVPLDVNGSLPPFLDGGAVYYGAPGAWPKGWWLDALVVISSYRFTGAGGATYSMQWNKDDAYNRTLAGLEPSEPLSLGTVPGTIPHPANSSWPTGVAFWQVDGCLVGSTGVSNTNQVDPDTLEPVELPFRYEDDLGGPYLAPAHAQTVDGYVLHHHITGWPKGSGGKVGYVVTSIKPGSRTRDVIATIRPKATWFRDVPSIQHMALATPEYYIMLESPCYYSETFTASGHSDWGGFSANTLARTYVRLISRATGKSTLYPLSYNVFSLHHINAYHDTKSSSIVIDTIQAFPSFLPCNLPLAAHPLDVDRNKLPIPLFSSKLLRIVLPLNRPGRMVSPRRIGNLTGVDYPAIPYGARNGRPYTFAYMCHVVENMGEFDSIVKLNVHTGAYTVWHAGPRLDTWAPVFVPDPSGASEDDGVVITNVVDRAERRMYLVVIDAKTMVETARIGPAPHTLPDGYHGTYYGRRARSTPERPAEAVYV